MNGRDDCSVWSKKPGWNDRGAVAIIHRVPGAQGAALLSVGGQALLSRQIEWLCSNGYDRVLVELAREERAAAELVRSEERVACRVVWTEKAIGPRPIARLAGIDDDEELMALPADLFGHARIGSLYRVANAFGAVAYLAPPRSLERYFNGGTVRVVRAPIRRRRPVLVAANGWGVRLAGQEDAARVSVAMASGAFADWKRGLAA